MPVVIPDSLKDLGTERALLATIIKCGYDAFVDVNGIVSNKDFSLPINKSIYACLNSLSEENIAIDIESIKMKAKAIGNVDFNNIKNLEYLTLLNESATDIKNIEEFAIQVKKSSVKRELYNIYSMGMDKLRDMTGDESLAEIISTAENDILGYLADDSGTDKLIILGEKIEERIKFLSEQEIVDQVGITTGYPLWDKAIGGGPRRGTVNIIGARPKTGKSVFAINQAINIASLNIPVLYLDTEMNEEIQSDRTICVMSKCPINLYETGKFRLDKILMRNIYEAASRMKKLPLAYQSISGKEIHEALSIARRWIIRNVGLNANGQANPCVIMYDYFKLTSSKSITNNMPEHIALGFLITAMHNFAHKYNIPVIAYCQLNRDGISSNDTDAVASSDRILWLCSSLSFIKNKDQNDEDMKCGFEYGNKCIRVVETRFGAGLTNEHDYINLFASMRPGVGELEACGYIREGFLKSQILGQK